MTRHTRDLLFAFTPAVLIAVAGSRSQIKFIKPAPPFYAGDHNRIAPEGAYYAYAQKYRAILARDRSSWTRLSAGSIGNLSPANPGSGVEAGFVRRHRQRAGAQVDARSAACLRAALDALPRQRQAHQPRACAARQCTVRRTATRALAMELLEANQLTQPPPEPYRSPGCRRWTRCWRRLGLLCYCSPRSHHGPAADRAPGVQPMASTKPGATRATCPTFRALCCPRGVRLVARMPDQMVLLASGGQSDREGRSASGAPCLSCCARQAESTAATFVRAPGRVPRPRDADFPLSAEAQRC